MNRIAMIFTVLVMAAFVLPAPADGIFGLFGKRTKANPNERVPELIGILKTDQEERKRSAAATELGSYDAAAFAEIVPALIDALHHDAKPSVRMDAVSSLGSVRPVSQAAGHALEQAVSGDDNMRVRWHAKGVLLKYRFAGYSSGSKGDAQHTKTPQTGEPPLLDPAGAGPRQTAPFPTAPVPATSTSMPKASPGKKDDVLEFRPSMPRQSPQGSAFSTSVPQVITRPEPQQLPMVDTDGPPLPLPLPSGPKNAATPAPF